MSTILLLLASNIFMTLAWYGHLRFKQVELWQVILVSWLIALPEYCLQVPANRWGHGRFSAFQLKILQEVITLTVFVFFAVKFLGESPRWNHLIAMVLVFAAVTFAFLPAGAPQRGRRSEPHAGVPPLQERARSAPTVQPTAASSLRR
ncbi:MAG: DMT family protein [Candidatus Riflebacteria bacterium]|nr:DMT family protein [Candidatus Riflebacteria bacterium]